MKRLTSVSALAFCAMAGPALADVTPQQVWDDLETYMESYGYSVEGSEALSGDALTVSDVVITMPIPEGEGSASFAMDQVVLTDRGDGTVALSFPESMPIAMKMDIEGDVVDMVLDYTHSGLQMVVSGAPEDMTYDYTADALGISLAKLMIDGEEITRDMARVMMTLTGLTGNSRTVMMSGVRNVSQTMAASDMVVDAAFNDPGSDDGGVFNVKLGGVAMSGETLIPDGLDFSDPMTLFQSGFAAAAEITHSGSAVEFAVTDNGTTNGTMTTGSGLLKFAMSDDQITYEVGNTDMVLAMAGPELPLPINAEMAETKFSFSMPLQASEEPQDAAIALTLAGFKTSEMIWNIFDPAAVLPRDPATVSADLTAKVTPFISLMDEEAMSKLETGEVVPGELNAVTLNSLLVEAAGGKITGDGAFTFDNSDTQSFDGLPRPEGTLNLSVSGAQGLIDKIIAMGLMSENDAMGARMMLSMFTVPGQAPDTATSTIEINDQGHVLANGQRIK
ncbi:DUF2125 domain-containing protein [Tropicibacter oceani]|uniref:DUF2125 domain-containing protein n=1 Tax=Tropicibacter oceani TaxID=3058420 RepID=A0ABY8QKB5_9RHOB|nr:DUF2125 domain-containing protein [Tropicibacter oceani]WGW04974.1 DUF2125 domain-containing protein [Tropicibacter oceani]